MSKLIQNALKTSDGVIIKSAHNHDFVQHGDFFVDGGTDFPRYGISTINNDYELLHVYDNDPIDVMKQKLIWGTYGKSGKNPLKYVKLIDCEIDHLENILKLKHINTIYQNVISSLIYDKKLIRRIEKINKIRNNFL